MCRSFALAPSVEECASCGACAPVGTDGLLDAPLQDIEASPLIATDVQAQDLSQQVRAALDAAAATEQIPQLALLRSLRAAAARGQAAELKDLIDAGCVDLLSRAMSLAPAKSSTNFVAWATVRDLCGPATQRSLTLRKTLASAQLFAHQTSARSRGKALQALLELAREPCLHTLLINDGTRALCERALLAPDTTPLTQCDALSALLLLIPSTAAESCWHAQLQRPLATVARDPHGDARARELSLSVLDGIVSRMHASPSEHTLEVAVELAHGETAHRTGQLALGLLSKLASRPRAHKERTTLLRMRALQLAANELARAPENANAWQLATALAATAARGSLPSIAQALVRALPLAGAAQGAAWGALEELSATPRLHADLVHCGLLCECARAISDGSCAATRAMRIMEQLGAPPSGAGLLLLHGKNLRVPALALAAATSQKASSELREAALGLLNSLAATPEGARALLQLGAAGALASSLPCHEQNGAAGEVRLRTHACLASLVRAAPTDMMDMAAAVDIVELSANCARDGPFAERTAAVATLLCAAQVAPKRVAFAAALLASDAVGSCLAVLAQQGSGRAGSAKALALLVLEEMDSADAAQMLHALSR